MFVVLAIVCVTVHGDSRWGLLTASLSLSAASYTRPEGPLIAACCISWFVGTRLATRRVGLIGRELCWLLGPLVVLISAHYLFRYTYYGEWLPNTYYAKHVRPWYESGFRYLWAATLETGLYLWLPLAALALRKAWQQRWDGRYALPLLCVVLHMAYLFRIGGDHFEYRPLDFYWPVLAVPVAAGIVCCGAAIHERLGLLFRHVGTGYVGGPVTWAVAVFAVVLFYSSAFQGVLLFEGSRTIRTRIRAVHIEVNEDNARWLLAAPGMPMIVAISNDLRRQMIRQMVAAPFVEHREFANLRIAQWKDYDRMKRGLIPEDAVMAANAIGIPFYYVPDLRVVDIWGLTDATVARHPVTTPNRDRIMAHDRRPPPGYLDERGVNFHVYESAGTAREALDRAAYAVLVGEDLWMPFDSSDPGWVVSRFGDRLIGFTDGWYARETGEKSFWRWTQQTARVLFSNPRTAAVLHLDYDARADLFQASPRTLTITVGGQVAHSFALEAAGRQQINVLLPDVDAGRRRPRRGSDRCGPAVRSRERDRGLDGHPRIRGFRSFGRRLNAHPRLFADRRFGSGPPRSPRALLQHAASRRSESTCLRSATNATGRGSTELGHPVQHVAREARFGLPPFCRPGSQSRSDDRFVVLPPSTVATPPLSRSNQTA